MTDAPKFFKAHLKALREAAGYTQEELATIAGLSVHAVGALERGEREARARLGPDRWAAASTAGRRISIDALLKDIDAVLPKGTAADGMPSRLIVSITPTSGESIAVTGEVKHIQ